MFLLELLLSLIQSTQYQLLGSLNDPQTLLRDVKQSVFNGTSLPKCHMIYPGMITASLNCVIVMSVNRKATPFSFLRSIHNYNLMRNVDRDNPFEQNMKPASLAKLGHLSFNFYNPTIRYLQPPYKLETATDKTQEEECPSLDDRDDVSEVDSDSDIDEGENEDVEAPDDDWTASERPNKEIPDTGKYDYAEPFDEPEDIEDDLDEDHVQPEGSSDNESYVEDEKDEKAGSSDTESEDRLPCSHIIGSKSLAQVLGSRIDGGFEYASCPICHAPIEEGRKS